VREQLAHGCYLAVHHVRVEPATLRSLVKHATVTSSSTVTSEAETLLHLLRLVLDLLYNIAVQHALYRHMFAQRELMQSILFYAHYI